LAKANKEQACITENKPVFLRNGNKTRFSLTVIFFCDHSPYRRQLRYIRRQECQRWSLMQTEYILNNKFPYGTYLYFIRFTGVDNNLKKFNKKQKPDI